jgi:stage III sporulation protein AH
MEGNKMNRKQGVIILALLILIVCAGALATKVQSPLYVSDTDLVDNSSVNNTNSTNSANSTNSTNQTTKDNKTNKTSSNQDYFAEARLTRDKTTQDTVAQLKEQIDDQNETTQNKQSAQQQQMAIVVAEQNSVKVETMLKGKGYEDAFCTINNGKVNVVVKANSQKLTDVQQREIRDVVLSVTQIRDIEIQPPLQ